MIFPYIGSKPFAFLEPADILSTVRPKEESGAAETAHRLAQLAGQVCRYARLVGYAKYDVPAGLTEALPSVRQKHLATITDPAKIGELLRAIDVSKAIPALPMPCGYCPMSLSVLLKSGGQVGGN